MSRHLPEAPNIQEVAQIPETPEVPPCSQPCAQPCAQPCDVDQASDDDNEAYDTNLDTTRPARPAASMAAATASAAAKPTRSCNEPGPKKLHVKPSVQRQATPEHVLKPGTLSTPDQTHFDGLTTTRNSNCWFKRGLCVYTGGLTLMMNSSL